MPLDPITGVLPPMLTPFRASGEIHHEAFTRNMRRWHAEGVAGYVVLGSNSETVYLDEIEKLDLIELAVRSAPEGLPVIAGTGLESTRGTIALTRRAAELGARAALLLTPSYYGGQMADEALAHHFLSVAEAAQIPILLYNVPRYTHLNLSVDLVAELAEHPNILGIKDSAGDAVQLARLQSFAGPEFQVFAGTASVWLAGLRAGVRAGIMALANCATPALNKVMELELAGRTEEADRLQATLNPVNRAVTATFGIPGLKAASDMCGYDAGSVRSPLLAATPEARDTIKRLLAEAGIGG